jgi:hypothetical protein
MGEGRGEWLRKDNARRPPVAERPTRRDMSTRYRKIQEKRLLRVIIRCGIGGPDIERLPSIA